MSRLYLVGDGETLDAIAELAGRLPYDAITRSDDPPRSVSADDQIVLEYRDPRRARDELARVLDRGEAGYLGLCAPEKDALVAMLALSAAGVSKARLDRVAAPAGLPIFATTVEERAIAVLAQLIAVRRTPSPPRRASA